MTEKDLYAALGVPRTASADDIKKAYRKLARKFHPDVNPGNRKAEDRFKEISEAHDVLGDAAKRKLYDEFGMVGVQAGFDPNQARAYREQAQGWQSAGTGSGGAGDAGFGGTYTNFEDLFGDIFRERGFAGQGGGFAGQGGGQPMRGEDAETEMEIDLLDALRGLSTTIAIQRQELCPTCSGSGADPASATTCPECHGEGRVQVGQGRMTMTRRCPRCGGAGKVSTKPCPTCNGNGHRVTTERINVRIPAGVDTGSRVRVAGKGGPGSTPGDLYIRVTVRPHALLERRGDDLYMDMPVKVGEAISGASIDVPTIDGTVRVRVPAGSQAGRQLRVRGRGAPQLRGKERGDLYLKLVVHVPQTETPAALEAARTLDAAYASEPRDGWRL